MSDTHWPPAGPPMPWFERLTTAVTHWVGSVPAFTLALLIVVVWAVTGPLFGYSDTWQLVINTGTTIITFLMVFIIQRSQNKDTLALQLKLNEVIASLKGASNRLIDIEDLSEKQVQELAERYRRLAARVAENGQAVGTCSVEDAEDGGPHQEGKAPARPAADGRVEV